MPYKENIGYPKDVGFIMIKNGDTFDFNFPNVIGIDDKNFGFGYPGSPSINTAINILQYVVEKENLDQNIVKDIYLRFYWRFIVPQKTNYFSLSYEDVFDFILNFDKEINEEV